MDEIHCDPLSNIHSITELVYLATVESVNPCSNYVALGPDPKDAHCHCEHNVQDRSFC